MINRKEIKQNAKKSLKAHYLFFIALCLFAAFIGAEFEGALSVLRADRQLKSAYDYSSVYTAKKAFTMLNSDIFETLVRDIARGNIERLRHLSDKYNDNSGVWGREKGVLAEAVNSASASLDAVGRLINKGSAAAIFAIAALLVHIMLLFLIKDCFVITSRRIFLEGRVYEKIPVRALNFLFLRHPKRWFKAALSMLVLFVMRTLWSLTVIAIPIVHYAYFLVPYILAENPEINPFDALRLSRRMMSGHKWECFKLSMSFILWDILDVITFGISAVFFTNAYKTACYSEYFVRLRSNAKKADIPLSGKLCDKYLYKKPTYEEIKSGYEDILEYINVPEENKADKSLAAFCEKWFGVVPVSSARNLQREKQISRQINIARLKSIASAETYPERLSPLKDRAEKIRLDSPSFMRDYSIVSIILMFFLFSFIGWLWEVSIHLVIDGVFVNRGVMHGPLLPIYGFGGIIVLIGLKRLRGNPPLEFIGIIVLCAVVEYFTSWFLERAYGLRWWDYSGYFLNLNGRICAEGLLTFGLGGMAVVYGLAPEIDNVIRRIKLKTALPLCIILICLLVADSAYSGLHPNSGKGINDYDKNEKTEQTVKPKAYTLDL